MAAGVTVMAAAAITMTLIPGPPVEAETPAHGNTVDKARTITLITGDQVTVDPFDDQATPMVTPAPGRESIPFHISQRGDELYVVPADAGKLIANGVLDKRLFDVATLIEQGYGDADRDDIPLIIRGGSTAVTAHSHQMTDLDIVATTQPKGSGEFWNQVTDATAATLDADVEQIWLDGKRRLSLDSSVPQIGAPDAWEAGYTGSGVTIAVLDTGVDDDHPDLAGQIREARDFTGGDDVSDQVGHGTHVAATVAGSGAASDGQYVGVAPDAELLIGKVCGTELCDESAILAGMEWAAQNGATAVNLSLGGTDGPEIDPLEQAVADLTAEYGTLFVIAAGNSYGNQSIDSPGSAEDALTVGAVDRDDQLADFSSRGPRRGDFGLKPDITAPGVEIVAARAAGTDMGTPVGDHYTAASGTSMATPHVAGAVAIIAQQHPGWTAAQLKAALMASAAVEPSLGAHEQGAGRMDVGAAMGQLLTAEPPSISVGLVEWPQDGKDPAVNELSYRNPTAEPVTLDLELTARGPDGSHVDGVFSLSDTIMLLPANGTANITVTTDLTGESSPGYYSAVIHATSGDLSVVTPILGTKEPESYDLTVEAIGRDGQPAEGFMLDIQGQTDDYWSVEGFIDGPSTTFRMPAIGYHIGVTVYGGSEDDLKLSVIHDTEEHSHVEDSVRVFDARDAEPVIIDLPDDDVHATGVTLSGRQFTSVGVFGPSLFLESFDQLFTAQYGPSLPDDVMGTFLMGTWSDGEHPTTDPTKAFTIAQYERGYFPTGYVASFDREDLVELVTSIRSQHGDYRGIMHLFATAPDEGVGIGREVSLPTTLTSFYNPSDEVTWRSSLSTGPIGEDGWMDVVTRELGGPLDYQPGETHREIWNSAVFAPGFAPAGRQQATRDGEDLHLDLPLYSSPQPDRFGYSMTDSARTILYQGDSIVGESDRDGYGLFSGLPSEPVEYRLVSEADRGGVSEFSSRIECEWTFTSSSNSSLVPLLSVRMAPEDLDDHNRATVTAHVTITLTVQNILGERVVPDELTAEVSFDGGEHWETTTITDGRTIVTADEAGFVSLRVTATDGTDNMVTQTVINAYETR